MRMIYLPGMPNVSVSRGHRQRQGRGMGSVLLGGVGSASSYESADDYMDTTGRKLGAGMYPMGAGLGAGMYPVGAGLGAGLRAGAGMDKSSLNKKLESLSFTPKKPKSKNIKFNL